jgi:hypothetical protein
MEYDKIYPVTILSDRYCGTYSKGKFLAFNANEENIPSGIDADDCTCSGFWDEQESNPKFIIGKGDSPNDAYIDLFKKLKK